MNKDPTWVNDISRYTARLSEVRKWYDRTFSTVAGYAPPVFGPIIHHALIATAVWSSFTYLPILGSCGQIAAYCIPFVLYIPLQRFSGNDGHHKHQHVNEQDDKDGHQHAQYHNFMETYPTAAAIGAAVGAATIAFCYSPLTQNTEFFIYANQAILQQVSGTTPEKNVTLATAMVSIVLTAFAAEIIIYIAQDIAANIYNYAVGKNATDEHRHH
ncbi:MAG: hypothetical protein JSS50_04885 [Proteobacteria bacterium]|nr:hypothetical protein [Pseudomonadota bacterium]